MSQISLLVCFASVSESQLHMKILPDDFISASVMQPYFFPCVVQALEEGPRILNKQPTEACLTLNILEIHCGSCLQNSHRRQLPVTAAQCWGGWAGREGWQAG